MTITQQVSLIPAGCQPWSLNVCASRGSRFAYAATLAIYIYEWNYETNQFYLHSIMSEHKRTITSIDWHPSYLDIIASSGTDMKIFIWHIVKHKVISTLNNPLAVPTLVAWLPGKNNYLTYCDGKGSMHTWKCLGEGNETDTSVEALKHISSVTSLVKIFCWHHSVIGQIALGHADGTISVFNPGQKPFLHVNLNTPNRQEPCDDEGSSVSSLLWDPFSLNYLLCSSSKHIRLIDVTTRPISIVTTYTAPSKAVAIRCVSWLTEVPGSFVSGDAETGVLRIWTVSKEKPLQSIKLKQLGFQSLCIMHAQNTDLNKAVVKSNDLGAKFRSRIVCLFVDGGIGVYSLKLSAWEYYRDMGHLETIFDCQFKPGDRDLLATASFDGTVKLWNVRSMDGVSSSPGDESIIYSISWAPAEVNCLVASTSKRGILIWDVSRGCITKRIDDHGQGVYVYTVAWNQKDARKIASGAADGTCMIHQSDGKLLNTFKHPATVFGCDWNLKNEAIIATACEDGNVRIFYDGAGVTSPLKTLSGHTGKVFRVRWSPLRESMLCSTSDDCSVRIWDYSTGTTVRTLLGHTNCTRGLLWSSELPNILISGSWDHTIRVWDVNDGACLDVIEDHGADVYGLACHPSRPFVFASTSRDSTVRLWSLLPLVSMLFVKALVKRPWSEIYSCAVTQKSYVNEPVQLCGSHSAAVKDIVTKLPDRFSVETLKALSSLFCPPNGIINLWDLAAVMKGNDPKDDQYGAGIVHRKHAVELILGEAQEKELVKMTRYGAGGVGAPSKDECLRISAEHYLLTGNLKKYCELKVELNEWDDALAVAPGVSLKYWHELSSRRLNLLTKDNCMQMVPLAIATGNIEMLLRFYKNQNSLEKAFLILVATADGLIKVPKFTEENEKPVNQKSTMDYELLIHENVLHRTEQYLLSGSPVLAACCQLAVDNLQEAVLALLRGNELELAISLAISLKYEGPVLLAAVTYISWRCVRMGEWDLAIDVLDLHPDSHQQKLKICIYCGSSISKRNELHKKVGLPSVDSCEKTAIYEQSNENIPSAVEYYLLSSNPKAGLDLGLQYVKECLKFPSWKLDPLWQLLDVLSCVQPCVLQDTSCDRHRFELQIYSAYIGALVALRQGFTPIVGPLLSKSLSLIRQVHNLECSLSEKYVEDSLCAWASAQNVQKDGVTDDLTDMLAEIQSRSYESEATGDTGVTIVSGSHLPRHSDQHNCFLRGSAIQGPIFYLEDCKSAISLNDALMWAKVNKFSPLGTGIMINPF